jgi:hypothetical protein
MRALVRRLAQSIEAPLMIGDHPKCKRAGKPGRAIVNSVHLESGRDRQRSAAGARAWAAVVM